jgi:photosystem II stability/assembly factor-like uncharacterized protein
MYVRIAVLLTAFSALSAQNVPVLFECTEDDAQTAGLHCSEEEPCPVFLELSAVEAVGNRLFLTGNLHSSAATLYSVLMTSSDAGKTWTEGYKRLRAAALDQIQFFDFETGWISGNYLSGTPRDPFFLVTGDGGTTWSALPVFEESRPAEIEKFWFESKTAGALLLDVRYANRFELYETKTGGESWELRQGSAKPIHLPKERPVANAAAWRLRPDAATRAYALEHAQGEHWQKVASFLVRVGKCTQ